MVLKPLLKKKWLSLFFHKAFIFLRWTELLFKLLLNILILSLSKYRNFKNITAQMFSTTKTVKYHNLSEISVNLMRMQHTIYIRQHKNFWTLRLPKANNEEHCFSITLSRDFQHGLSYDKHYNVGIINGK